MSPLPRLLLSLILIAPAAVASDPPPAWEAKVGFSWLESSGNTTASSLGLDATTVRRWDPWTVDVDGKLLRAESNGATTADRWSLGSRAARSINELVSLSASLRFEADELGGLDRRTVASLGTVWALSRSERWTFDLATELAWTDERYADAAANGDFLGAVIDGRGELVLSPSATLIHRLGVWPSFDDGDDYRLLGDLALQADLNSLLALRLGYEWRYDGVPAPGFGTTDRTVTAAVVLRATRAAAARPAE